MKKIVCEMCECTDFVKEDGLFVCQGCGCKYSFEDAKKMMRDVDHNETHIEDDYADEEHEEYEEIPLHTADSPNKLSVSVIKVGHETYTMKSVNPLTMLVGDPQPEFVDGPDSVGHIGAEILVKNLAGKTIKYVVVYLAPLNNVRDQVGCTVQGHSVYGVRVTGPLAVGETYKGHADGIWYNHSIVDAKVDHVHVIYMDDTEEIYEGKEFYETTSVKFDANPGENSATLTVRRNQPGVKVTTTNKLNRLVCHLSNGVDFEVPIHQTVTLPIKHGTYTIEYDFWGKSIVPAKNKKSPEFTVTGDVYIELSPDPTWGGIKTKIISKEND